MSKRRKEKQERKEKSCKAVGGVDFPPDYHEPKMEIHVGDEFKLRTDDKVYIIKVMREAEE